MKQIRNFVHFSFIAAAVVVATPALAAVRINNTSRPNRADAYHQINAQYYQQPSTAQYYDTPTAPAAATDTALDSQLPIRVANPTLAAQIARGDATNVDMNRLNACAAIYPDGEFEWASPTIGTRAGAGSTCGAVVEMRGYQMGPGGTDVVLARANLASGDVANCNIDEFPVASYTADASNITFPADTEPTMDDVIAVMNEEQKQNAGIKIAASVLIGGIGGNMAGDAEPGKTGAFGGLIGGGKDKIKGTIAGALGAGAVTAASAYSGKVAGDTIMAAGVNAAAGGVVGNIVGGNDTVLRIEDCKMPDGSAKSCLWGMLVMGDAFNTTDSHAYFNISDGKTVMVCASDDTGCGVRELASVKIKDANGTEKLVSEFESSELASVPSTERMYFDSETQKITNTLATGGDVYVPVTSATVPAEKIPAVAAPVTDKAFGMTTSDWTSYDNKDKVKIYRRGTNGVVSALDDVSAAAVDKFHPMTMDSGDGGIIDLGNRARLKSTLIGAGSGAALGAFTGYQGATSDVENRWVTAVREYKDSLQKIYCATGNRFLGYYNSTIQIPTAIE